MKRTIIIDTDNNTIELLREGYNMIASTNYDERLNREAQNLLIELVKESEIR